MHVNTSLQKLFENNRPLAVNTALTTALIIFFSIGIIADSRMVTGVPVWLKPFKFAISISVYCFTMLFFLNIIDKRKAGRARLVNILSWTIVLTFMAEWFAIIIQAFRGTTSHFNIATPFDIALWGIMTVAILILWIANFIIAGLLIFQKFENKAFAWSLRLGIIITIIGMGLGYLMTSPTAIQMASWQAGGAVTAGAHTVGLPDGGAGLPLFNWSTEGGDLRIGHFIGMHALQVIPLFGFFVTRRTRQRKVAVKNNDSSTARQDKDTKLVFTAAFSYLAIVLLVTWQALRGQSIIAPDILTIGSFIAICIATLLSIIIIQRPKYSALSIATINVNHLETSK